MEEGAGVVLAAGIQPDHDEACCPVEMTRPPDDSSEGLGAPCLWCLRERRGLSRKHYLEILLVA
jgi:hypothetical protein